MITRAASLLSRFPATLFYSSCRGYSVRDFSRTCRKPSPLGGCRVIRRRDSNSPRNTPISRHDVADRPRTKQGSIAPDADDRPATLAIHHHRWRGAEACERAACSHLRRGERGDGASATAAALRAAARQAPFASDGPIMIWLGSARAAASSSSVTAKGRKRPSASCRNVTQAPPGCKICAGSCAVCRPMNSASKAGSWNCCK
jgi:hypothetical protein